MSESPKPQRPDLFPVAMGNEEESMLMTGKVGQRLRDPEPFVSRYRDFIPSGIRYTPHTPRTWLQNGGMMYDGGSIDVRRNRKTTNTGPLTEEEYHASRQPLEDSVIFNVNLERTTPECSGPRELATYIQANEKIYVEMLKNYITSWADIGVYKTARAQRRVVDSEGVGRGCHDSIEVRNHGWLNRITQGSEAEIFLCRFLQTRTFMVGAGYVAPNGSLHLSQKIEHLQKIREYGYLNSAYRVVSDQDTGPRLEVRCNDINISPWAIQSRAGGLALFSTILQTPLRKSLDPMVPQNANQPGHFFHSNNIEFDEDGQIIRLDSLVQAVDFQEKWLAIADENLAEFVELNDEYKTLINEMLYYCQDMRKVLKGELEFSVLADRSDMAAKFDYIISKVERAKKRGASRQLGDMVSRMYDMQYDVIEIDTDEHDNARVSYGYGYGLRDIDCAFRLPIRQNDVNRATLIPPAATRASIRGNAIKLGQAARCNWSFIEDEDASTRTVLRQVMLPSPKV